MAVRTLVAVHESPPEGSAAAGVDRTGPLLGLLAHYEAEEHAADDGEGTIEGARITTLRLPASYAKSRNALREVLVRDEPDIFLLLGTDTTSSDYKLHVLAANYADHEEPDVDGTILTDTIIDPDGPVAYRSRLPLDGIWDKFLVERVPVRMSHKAGLGLYNHTFYTAMRTIDVEGLSTRGGAIETPAAPGDARGDAEPRRAEELEEELLMVLGVLTQLHPAALPTDPGARSPPGLH